MQIYVALGQGIAVGGNPGSIKGRDDGGKVDAHGIADHAFIESARILGAIDIGRFALIGANIVWHDIPPLRVYVESPAR